MTDNNKQKLKNIEQFMANNGVIIVHQNENIFAKIAKCMEKTK